MKTEYFRGASSNDAGGEADDGRGKLALVPYGAPAVSQRRVYPTAQMGDAEQLLLDTLMTSIQAIQPLFACSLLFEYYKALQAAPLIFLGGDDLPTAALLGRLFAEAIVGQYSNQIVAVSDAAWHDATGEGSYYRSLHERFSTIRCQAIFQEAAAAANVGKAYFISFDPLPIDQVTRHLAMLMADGIPPSLVISAVIPAEQLAATKAQFPQALVVQVRTSLPRANDQPALPPPVGLQRLWLHARRANASAALLLPAAEYAQRIAA